MKISVIGLGHAFNKQLEAINQTGEFVLSAVCDKQKSKLVNFNKAVFATTNFKQLANKCDVVLVATPPSSHFRIASYFIKRGICVLIEKPIVTSLKQLGKLQGLLQKHKGNLFCTQHFAFGEEVLFWLKKQAFFEMPKQINAQIYDQYVYNNSILPHALPLHGAYLDEVINPLSAIQNIFGSDIVAAGVVQKRFKHNKHDYACTARFVLNQTIPICIDVLWQEAKNDKYIDLVFANQTIRLDSMSQAVIDLQSNKTLFKAEGNRMTNHYLRALRHFLRVKQNAEQTFALHNALLENLCKKK